MLLGDNGLVSIVHIEYIRLDLVVPFKYTIPRRRFDNRRLRGTINLFSSFQQAQQTAFSSYIKALGHQVSSSRILFLETSSNLVCSLASFHSDSTIYSLDCKLSLALGSIMSRRILFVIVIISFSFSAYADDCLEWFKNANIKPNAKNCLIDCAIAPVGLGDFMCRDRCDEFCKVSQAKETIFKLSDLYPGLTSAERAMAADDPVKALGAYKLSWKAEEVCHSLYAKSKTNDASDACRHYVWAGLLTNAYGKDYALRILNAHEQDPLQPKEELAMDNANNRLGILHSESLIKNKKFSEDTLLESFKEALKKSEIVKLKE